MFPRKMQLLSTLFYNNLKQNRKSEHFQLLTRFHKSSYLALTIKNEITKCLARYFTNVKLNCQNSVKFNFQKFNLLFTVLRIFNKNTRTNKLFFFQNLIETRNLKKQNFNEKVFKNFKRNFERMMNLRKMQVFCAIQNFASLKQTIITLNSVDLISNENNYEGEFNDRGYEKENFNPNPGYSFNEYNEINDWMYF